MKIAGFEAGTLNDQTIPERLAAFFEPDALERIARQSRFIERSTSRLSGWMFLQLHLLLEANGKEASLSQMCEQLYELLFKIWKSVLELDRVDPMSIFRFECYLYSRLLVLSMQVANLFTSEVEGFELSNWKQ